jgi:hypothetical protein
LRDQRVGPAPLEAFHEAEHRSVTFLANRCQHFSHACIDSSQVGVTAPFESLQLPLEPFASAASRGEQ